MPGSCDDIQEYLNIIKGNFPKQENNEENTSINLGISTAGAQCSQTYIHDNGLRWVKLLEDDENCWLIEHGFLEHDADATEYITKHDMATMIRSGEMNLIEESLLEVELLEESLTLEDNEFDEFMDKVERYLIINEDRESFDLEYDWHDAWLENKTPVESIEEAILLEK